MNLGFEPSYVYLYVQYLEKKSPRYSISYNNVWVLLCVPHIKCLTYTISFILYSGPLSLTPLENEWGPK